jgi:hypothetical protein
MRFVCLIAAEAARSFAQKGFRVVGIDNNLRKYFFAQGFQLNKAAASLLQDCRIKGFKTPTFATKNS